MCIIKTLPLDKGEYRNLSLMKFLITFTLINVNTSGVLGAGHQYYVNNKQLSCLDEKYNTFSRERRLENICSPGVFPEFHFILTSYTISLKSCYCSK